MILNRDDALYAANVFTDYFSNFGRIDDYLRKVKLERMSNYPTSLPGMGPEDDMFDSSDNFFGKLSIHYNFVIIEYFNKSGKLKYKYKVNL